MHKQRFYGLALTGCDKNWGAIYSYLHHSCDDLWACVLQQARLFHPTHFKATHLKAKIETPNRFELR
ncbi:hypothetical protein [Moraxella nonliquefaciens]|uniref:hypothetical protein n=1 Tax=Moraxella nonliquefaciens TaxID=478 RepID=UPI0012E8C35A|nr:hypothetical protein [Moraxella nonliquefaciens]